MFTLTIFYFYLALKNTCFNSITHYKYKKHLAPLKLAPEKSFFMLPKVKFLGHEIGYKTIKPIHSKVAAIHKIPSPTGKVALMSFIGALNFYTKFIGKLQINLKPFHNLLRENNLWKWTDEHERLFQISKRLSLLKQNLQYQRQNTHFLLQLKLHLLD